MEFDLPEHGFVFYPVGTGDSTTIAVDEETIVQVDLRALECADEEADPHFAIVDALIERLPERDGKRYLAAFGLTHADKDHCLGFKELLGRDDVIIGELWFSPRVLWEHDDLSEDAKAFCAEAERRIKVNCQGPADSGDRIRVIGDQDVLEEYDGL